MQGIAFFLVLIALGDSVATKNKDLVEKNADLAVAFEVSRKDGQKGACFSINEDGKRFLMPTYDLENLQLPSGGFTWNWTNEWQMTNLDTKELYLTSFENRRNYVFSDGGENWLLLADSYLIFSILASNASLWLLDSSVSDGKGFLVQIDHTSENNKFTRVLDCEKLPLDGEQEKVCTTLITKNDTNLLNDGMDWAPFEFRTNSGETDEEESVDFSFVKWSAHTGSAEFNVSWKIEQNDETSYVAFARTHQAPGVFNHLWVNAVSSLANTNSLSKNFTQPRAGKFCVQINGYFEHEFYYELLNWRNNKVDTTGNLRKTANWIRVEFDRLQAGDYQLTFRNVSEIIEFIEMCPGRNFERTPVPPVASSHCNVVAIQNNGSSGHLITLNSNFSHARANFSLKTGWGADEWTYVCDQLGVTQNVSESFEVEICNPLWGCKFSKCPNNAATTPTMRTLSAILFSTLLTLL